MKMAEPSTTTDNPATATQGAPSSGDVLTDLVQSYQDKHPAPSEGEPASTQEPSAPAETTGQPEGAAQPDDSGKLSRLEQQLAQQNKLLSSIGIDPESDIAEKVAAGVLSPDDILRGRQEPTPQPTVADTFGQLEQEIQAKVESGQEVTQTDFLKFMRATKELAAQSARTQEQRQMEALVNDCESAMVGVLGTDEAHSNAPENIRKIEQEMFLSSTDVKLGQDARTFGNNPNFFKPQTFTHYAQKNLPSLQEYRNYWIEQGKKMQMNALNPKPTPNPVSSATGSGSIPAPQAQVNLDNLAATMRNYMKNQGAV
jgi:hypothetical protein